MEQRFYYFLNVHLLLQLLTISNVFYIIIKKSHLCCRIRNLKNILKLQLFGNKKMIKYATNLLILSRGKMQSFGVVIKLKFLSYMIDWKSWKYEKQ